MPTFVLPQAVQGSGFWRCRVWGACVLGFTYRDSKLWDSQQYYTIVVNGSYTEVTRGLGFRKIGGFSFRGEGLG